MNPPCTCTHAEKGHCPGGVKHSFYKQELRPGADYHLCTSRHCLSPLCDCVRYAPGEPTGDREVGHGKENAVAPGSEATAQGPVSS